MCTVTYIPAANGFSLTSNRDERHTRMAAAKPAVHEVNGVKLIYPKDATAQGTWIVMKQNGDAICLLNGAFETHIPQPPYSRSRGLIVLDIASQTQMAGAFNSVDLYRIEPFTIILVEKRKLYECRWDGSQKFFLELKEKQSHIWSSSTLYPLAARLRRKQWFEDWQTTLQNPSPTDIFKFHVQTGDGDTHNDLVMNRNNEVFTVSITGIFVQGGTLCMQYFDLLKNEITNIAFDHKLQPGYDQ